jgi:hypothetical protein
MIADAELQYVTPDPWRANTKDEGRGAGFDHISSEPALLVNVVEIWVKRKIRRVPGNASEFGLVAVAAGRNQVQWDDGERGIICLRQVVVERRD